MKQRPLHRWSQDTLPASLVMMTLMMSLMTQVSMCSHYTGNDRVEYIKSVEEKERKIPTLIRFSPLLLNTLLCFSLFLLRYLQLAFTSFWEKEKTDLKCLVNPFLCCCCCCSKSIVTFIIIFFFLSVFLCHSLTSCMTRAPEREEKITFLRKWTVILLLCIYSLRFLVCFMCLFEIQSMTRHSCERQLTRHLYWAALVDRKFVKNHQLKNVCILCHCFSK